MLVMLTLFQEYLSSLLFGRRIRQYHAGPPAADGVRKIEIEYLLGQATDDPGMGKIELSSTMTLVRSQVNDA